MTELLELNLNAVKQEIPTANPAWKIRFGVSNDYNSRPGEGFKKLDTSYFTRMVLDWQ